MERSPPISQAFLVENARGLAYAAFAPIAALAARLGCDEHEARGFQEDAKARFFGLMIAVKQARHTPARAG